MNELKGVRRYVPDGRMMVDIRETRLMTTRAMERGG
jgi:hypothetical protein